VSGVATALVVLTAVGSAAVGGVFLAFDGFVLRALGDLPGAGGADAMRAINITAVRPPLMVAMFGTAALALAVLAVGVTAGGGARAVLLVGGAVAYLVGVIGTTMVRNVPLNDALARDTSDETWARYRHSWGRANLVRTVSGLVGSAALVLALAL
jgi:uncharacterized membrane protein